VPVELGRAIGESLIAHLGQVSGGSTTGGRGRNGRKRTGGTVHS
jgi:hypothetical protein